MKTRAALRACTLAGTAVVSLMLANNAAMPATVEQTPQDEELTIGQENL